jgi:hypothetical protein
MKFSPALLFAAIALTSAALTIGCGEKKPAPTAATASPAKHEHHPPHGGTPVVLGDESYHLELVRDAATGELQAFVLDGEMENFVRCAAPSFEVIATIKTETRTLIFTAQADLATGEKIGDTALFTTQAEWLKTTNNFNAVLTTLTVRGTAFTNVSFNFPRGNDPDNQNPAP